MEDERSIRFGLGERLLSAVLSIGSPLPVTPLNSLTGRYYVGACLVIWIQEAQRAHECFLKRSRLLLKTVVPVWVNIRDIRSRTEASDVICSF